MQKNKNENALLITKNKKIELIYFAIIILGALFIILPAFHTNLWFDESFTVALIRHDFTDVINIGKTDVHPILYYLLVKLIFNITNGNIVLIRLFSSIPVIIMAILGFTHIRKDLGDKVGILYTFFTLFAPAILIYSMQIRMYTWAMLFVTIMAIYSYRIIKYRFASKKNWIIFSIFSLASAYSHYYGLITAFVINVLMFAYFIIKSLKNKKVKESRYHKNLKYSIISAILQVLLYIPWLKTLFMQAGVVGAGFWIGKIDLIEMLEFQFTGNLNTVRYLPKIISVAFSSIALIYLIYLFLKNKNRDEIKPAKLALLTYFLVILIAGLISFWQVILYARYLLIITGIFIIMASVILSREKNKNIAIICLITLILSVAVNINLININYDKSNKEPLNYVSNNLKENDIFIVDNNGSGFALATMLNINNDNLYFWNRDNWNVEEPYKAFGSTIYNLDEIKSFSGRIWTVSTGNSTFQEDVANELDSYKITETKYFDVKYENYKYTISLIERKDI